MITFVGRLAMKLYAARFDKVVSEGRRLFIEYELTVQILFTERRR